MKNVNPSQPQILDGPRHETQRLASASFRQIDVLRFIVSSGNRSLRRAAVSPPRQARVLEFLLKARPKRRIVAGR
jgi:hypothetical protein